MREIIHTSAPGSLMICGEHAVVYGAAAIVYAVSERAHIYLKPLSEKKLVIHSALGHYESALDVLKAHPNLRFVIEAVRQNSPNVGIELTIESEINPTLGFASSAAVTVATIKALLTLNNQSHNTLALHEVAHRVILAVQKRGSGADVAAAVAGGMIAYRPSLENKILKLPLPPLSLSVRYAGYKTPTAEVLEKIAKAMNIRPQYYQRIYDEMAVVSQSAIDAAIQQDWMTFYAQLNHYQHLMDNLGVCDATQTSHLSQALAGNAVTAKISGSGLGDCIIVFSENLLDEHQRILPSKEGVMIYEEEAIKI